MNNKGEMNTVGLLVVVAVVLIVGVIFMQSIAQNVGDTTNTITLANSSFTLASEGDSVYLTNYRAISSPVIYNATGELVPAANYTITNNVVYNGALAIKIETAAVNAYANDSANISGTAQPLTYIAESGGRATSNLIPIMFALLLAVIALYPVYSSKLKDLMGM